MSKIKLTEKEMAVLLGESASFIDNGDGHVGEGDVIVDKTATDATMDTKLKPITLDASANTLEGLAKVIEGVTSRKTYVVTDRDNKQYASFGCGKECDKGSEYIVSEPLVGFGDLVIVGGDIVVTAESDMRWVSIYNVDVKDGAKISLHHDTFRLDQYCPVKGKKVEYACATDYARAIGEYESDQDYHDETVAKLQRWRKNILTGFTDGKAITYDGVVEYLNLLRDIEKAGREVQAEKQSIEDTAAKNYR